MDDIVSLALNAHVQLGFPGSSRPFGTQARQTAIRLSMAVSTAIAACFEAGARWHPLETEHINVLREERGNRRLLVLAVSFLPSIRSSFHQ